ncbi:MAG TPA: GDSL-type esterase/lipase family protein [Candidatus Paceibacterota bacterium]
MHLKLAIGMAVLAVALYAFYQYALIARAIAAGKPLVAAAVPYEQHPANAAHFILVMGDSTAVGVGAATSSESLAGRVGAYYPDADVENLGASGAQLPDLLGTIPSVPRDQYDLILLQIGANDVVYGSVGMAQMRISEALAWASAHSGRVILLTAGNIGLSPVFKWPLSLYMTHRTLALRSIFMTEAAAFPNVSYVDLYLSKEDDPFGKDVPHYYAPDRFHPSSSGYAYWFDSVKRYLPAL